MVTEAESIQDDGVPIFTIELVAPLLRFPIRIVAAVKQDFSAVWVNGAKNWLAILGLIVFDLDHVDRLFVPVSLTVPAGSIRAS